MSDATDAMKKLRTAKAQHTAHVSLIMVQDNLAKPDALFKAYQEGPAGLTKRTNGAPKV